MTEQMNMPKLRFSEFEGEYIDTALEDLTKKKISYGIVQAGPHIPDGMPYIKSTNLNKELCLEELERTSDAIAKSYQRSEVAPEDIVFSLRGNIGATRIVPETIPVANLTQGTARLSIGENFSNVYINYCLSTRKAYKRVNSVSKGSTFQEISLADLRKVKVTHSVDIKEQQKIASFLSKVDEKITLLTEKKDKLTEYKKGVMQQLFNGKWKEQDGHLIFIPPTLRFKAADGSEFPDWEEKKLGDVLTIGNGRDYKHLSDGDIPVFGTGGYMTSVDGYLYDGETVFIGRKGTINKPYMFNGKFWTVDTLFYTKDFKDILPKFVYAIFQKVNWSLYNEATGVPSLSKSTINKIRLNVPSLSEQEKITEFISSLDQKIDLVNEELEKAKEWKKGLLQQMFV
ncbi:restriction endonuclease subunit S [Vibrio alginolyticus]